MGDTPTSPARTSPLQPFPGFRRSDILACGRSSLVRYYAHTEQIPLNLNTYRENCPLHPSDTRYRRPVASGHARSGEGLLGTLVIS